MTICQTLSEDHLLINLRMTYDHRHNNACLVETTNNGNRCLHPILDPHFGAARGGGCRVKGECEGERGECGDEEGES